MTTHDAEMLVALIRSEITENYILVSKEVYEWATRNGVEAP